MPWIITGVLAFVVGLIVLTEIRCGRRNKIFQAKIDPAINDLKDSVLMKYREKFGRDPTEQFPIINESKTRRGLAKKS